MKYIMLDEKIPIIFPESLEHKDVAKMFEHSAFEYTVTSAGHVKFMSAIDAEPMAIVDGKSFSLNSSPAEADQEIIEHVSNEPNDR